MPCEDTHNWTFSGLLGAFLDLSIAYLFLCASLLVYLASTFLGFFGLSLPRSHNGRCGDANQRKCLQGCLMDRASEKISAVDGSVKSKIPFDSIMADHSNHCLELKENGGDIGNLRLPGEASCRFLQMQQEQSVMNNGGGGFGSMGVQGVKGKRFVTRRSRNGLRNRKKGRVDPGGLLSVSVFDSLQTDLEMITSWPRPPRDVSRIGEGSAERGPEAADSEDGKNAAEEINLQQNLSHGSEFDEPQENHKNRETVSSTNDEEIKRNASTGESFDTNAENTIRVLTEALEEEHSARAAMCIELEQERSAAASAADEAMAMILRLQDEKASIEMEARQFQRMIEEKSAFDAEEMNILRDILVRRERESHFLEKEVEAYREILVKTDELKSFKREGPDQMLLTSSESSIENEKIKRPEKNLNEKTITLVQEETKVRDNGPADSPYREDNTKKSREGLYKSDSEVYSRVRDVHVVKDKANVGKTQNIGRKNLEASDHSIICRHESRGNTVSDMARRLPPLCRPRGTILNSSGSRRKSMSAMDYERLKIESEVGWLQERLRVVQEGRQKLTRGASLPPLSSKKLPAMRTDVQTGKKLLQLLTTSNPEEHRLTQG